MISNILVPLDGSQLAEAAVPHAVALARASPATLHLFRAIQPQPSNTPLDPAAEQALLDTALAYLRKVAEPVATEDLPVHIAARIGPAVEEILFQSARAHADLIVMATRGESGIQRLLLGSTAERILQESECPVLLIQGQPAVRPYHTILVPLDGTIDGEAILPVVADLARAQQAKLVLLTAIPPLTMPPFAFGMGYYPTVDIEAYTQAATTEANSYLENLAEPLSESGMSIEIECRLGDPPKVILEEVEQVQADLIALVSHTRLLVGRLFFGSLPDYLLHHASIPVLVYHSGHIGEAKEQTLEKKASE